MSLYTSVDNCKKRCTKNTKMKNDSNSLLYHELEKIIHWSEDIIVQGTYTISNLVQGF